MKFIKYSMLSFSILSLSCPFFINGMNKPEEQGPKTPNAKLLTAIGKGNLEAVKNAVEKESAELDYSDKKNFAFGPPLADAVQEGNISIVKYLLSKGAPVDQANRYGQRPIALAIAQDNPEMLRILLEAKANPNLRSSAVSPIPGHKNEVTPLEYAQMFNRKNQEELVKLLRQYGAQ